VLECVWKKKESSGAVGKALSGAVFHNFGHWLLSIFLMAKNIICSIKFRSS